MKFSLDTCKDPLTSTPRGIRLALKSADTLDSACYTVFPSVRCRFVPRNGPTCQSMGLEWPY